MTVIRLGTFTKSVLVEVARMTGALERASLVVVEHTVASSPAQFRSLRNGELDAVVTNPDNVLAYRFVPDNPLSELLDVKVTGAIDRGLGLTLCAGPAISSVQSGLRLGVDAATSGFALLAYALLERRGIDLASLRVETSGTTPARAMAILAGECDLTMLNAGHEIVALDRGCTVVGRADEIGPYLGSVLATLGNEPTGDLERLERVLREVSAAIVDGSLEAPARAASSTMLGLSVRHAAQHVAVMRDSRHGLVPSGIVDADSIDTVLTLRERFFPSPALDRARADWRGMLVAQ